MDNLRIGDEEREGAIAALGLHFSTGRLSMAEFERRAGLAAAAQVRAELPPLFADLPAPHPVFLERSALPDELRDFVAAEGALVLIENAPGEVTYRRYRAPGVRFRRRTITAACTVAVTGRRLNVWAGGAKLVNVPLDHPLRSAVTLTAERPDLLCVTVDVGMSQARRSGRIEIRVRTTRAVDVLRYTGSQPRPR